MKHWKDLQHVDSGDVESPCRSCGANLLDVFSIKYSGETRATPAYTEELYECRKCQALFVIRYNLFEKDGHITTRTFTGDINDPTHNWQNRLTDEQARMVSEHMESCAICKDKANEEMLKDAWFATLLRGKVKE